MNVKYSYENNNSNNNIEFNFWGFFVDFSRSHLSF